MSRAASRGPRSVRRALLGVALVIAGVLTPVSSASLPDELQHLAPEAPVMAQTPPPGIVNGTSNPCPSTTPAYVESGAECVLETEACPRSPINTSTIMQLSIGYPAVPDPGSQDMHGATIDRYRAFCEQRFDEVADPTGYASCTGQTGFIVMRHEMRQNPGTGVTEHMCRLIHPVSCIAGLLRVASNTCRDVQRRTWSCPAGTVPTNVFEKCYTIQSGPTGTTHPACGAGAPEIVVQDCGDYVAGDYAPNPGATAWKCATTFAMADNPTSGTSADYWCAFDSALLKVICHSASPPAAECTTTNQLCLKRASRTGGCDAIAKTILCREQQADHQADPVAVTVVDVRAAGCEPCVLLPFEPTPSSCPADTRNPPSRQRGVLRRSYDAIHRAKASFYVEHRACTPVRLDTVDFADSLACQGASRHMGDCDAPLGRLTWGSSHVSELALVNSPVVLTVIDVPGTVETVRGMYFFQRGPNRRIEAQTASNYLMFDDDQVRDRFVRMWPELNPTVRYSHVARSGGVPYMPWWGPGYCVISAGPYWARGNPDGGYPDFRVTIEQLWPDIPTQYNEILSLFGPQALDWWTTPLSAAAKQSYIEAQGENLDYWPNLSTQADRDQELEDRADAYTEVVPCNFGAPYWCRWMPTRSGYFKATAGGAWIVKYYRNPGFWTGRLQALIGYLQNPANRQQVDTEMTGWELSAEQLGLDPLLMDQRAEGSAAANALDYEWLYTTESNVGQNCPAIDVRVTCYEFPEQGEYTKTEPVGIQVHEVRVVTRLPNT